MSPEQIVCGRQRATAPTAHERRHGLSCHVPETFSLGHAHCARPFDPHRNDRANSHLPPRHYWIPGGASGTDYLRVNRGRIWDAMAGEWMDENVR